MSVSRRRPRHQRPISRHLPALIGGGLVAVFAGYAVVGPNGALAWSDYRSRHEVAEQKLAEARKERDALSNRVRLLNPAGADADLADELARRELGVIRSDEVVLPIR